MSPKLTFDSILRWHKGTVHAEKMNKSILEQDPEDETAKKILAEINQIKTNFRHAGQPYVRV